MARLSKVKAKAKTKAKPRSSKRPSPKGRTARKGPKRIAARRPRSPRPSSRKKTTAPLRDEGPWMPKVETSCSCGCGHDHAPVEEVPPVAVTEATGGEWKGAFNDVVDFLRYLDDITRAIESSDIAPGEFLDMLRELDETGQTICKLGEQDLDGMDRMARMSLFRAFLTDVFITKMKLQGELEPLLTFEILKLAQQDDTKTIDNYVRPIFSRMFLGFMQTVIAAHLSTGRGAGSGEPDSEEDMFPEPALLDSLWTDGEPQVLGFTMDDLKDGLWTIVTPIDMLRLTSTAVMAFLTWRDPKMGEDRMIEALSTISPPAFLLLACTDSIRALTEGLVKGAPLTRKVRDDGSGSRGAGFFFVLTKEGQERFGQ